MSAGPFPRQSTCVALSARAVLIDGPPGSGKSALALALIDRGAVLIGDDSVMLEACDGRLLARPHPATRGLLEVRNLGLLPFPVCEVAPVALRVLLSTDAPRYVEEACAITLAGITIPALSLHPEPSPPALKAELALARYGLRF